MLLRTPEDLGMRLLREVLTWRRSLECQ